MLVTVTQSDIRKGHRYSATACPVARAITRAVGKFITRAIGKSYASKAVSVSPDTVVIPDLSVFSLPRSAQRFIASYDSPKHSPKHKRVAPFRFILPLEVPGAYRFQRRGF